MRFEESRNLSRQRGSRSFVQAKNRYYPTRGEMEEETTPDSGASSRQESFHARGRKSNKLESSFRKPASRRRALLSDSDESSPESKNAPHGLDHSEYPRRESDHKNREGPYKRTTKEIIQTSYDEDSEELPSTSRIAYTSGNANEVSNEDYNVRRRGQRPGQWQQVSNLYDEVFSEHSDSKSRSSSDSSGSYSSSSDDDDDFQVNANCMNALFSKDGEKTSNLIRCDKAGPSATEVQLKMTLPLPLQFMEGIDNLVPSKREFASAMKHLRYNGDKFAKKCDFDYNRLDEQVIIDEEFAGEVMPEFYKSLFEAPSEVTSDGEDESEHQQKKTASREKNEEAAFDANPSRSKFTVPMLAEGDSAGSIVRPESLPSHILIGEDDSFVSSQGSFEMTPFVAPKQFDGRRTLEPVLRRSPRDTSEGPFLVMPMHSTAYPSKTNIINPTENSSQVGNRRDRFVQPSMRELIAAGNQPEQKPRSSNQGAVQGVSPFSQKMSYESVQEHPSFDEGHFSKTGPLEKRLPKNMYRRHLDEIHGQKEKNALSKFNRPSQIPSRGKKEWIPARREQLDLVDQAYPSFDVPEDELPKLKLQRPNNMAEKEENALVDGIPISVDYQKRPNEKDLGTIYSDLTVDEEAFDMFEYPVVETLSLSDQSNLAIPDPKIKASDSKEKSRDLEKEPDCQSRCIDPTMDIGSPSLLSGDEIMGRDENSSGLGESEDKNGYEDTDDSSREKESLIKQSSHATETDPDQGPMDEVMSAVNQMMPKTAAVDIHTGQSSSRETVDSTLIEELGPLSNQAKYIPSNPNRLLPYSPSRGSGPWEKEDDEGGLTENLPASSRDKDSLPTFGTKTSVAKQTAEEVIISPIITPVASIDQCTNTDVLIDTPKGCHASASRDTPQIVRNDQIVRNEESFISTRMPSPATAEKEESCQPNRPQSDITSRSTTVQHRAETTTTPQTDDNDVTRNNFEDEGELGTSSKNVSRLKDFASRLKIAAAARLDAMNDNDIAPSVARNITPEEVPQGDQEATQEINQGEEESSNHCEHVTAETSPGILSDEKSISKSSNFEDECPDPTEDEEHERDVFVDASCQDFLDDDAVSEDDTRESASESDRVRFLSEVDARSQAVEINYIGELTNRHDDSQSFATEPPLVIAPTLETHLSTAYTMDTPVEAPPVGMFETMDRSAWGSSSTTKKIAGLRDDFYNRDHDEDDYHFDERLAKLSALLPASEKRGQATRELASFNLAHWFVNGMTAFVLVIVSWLKHITGLQRERYSAPKATKSEPNFRGYQVALDIQSTTSQKIQGNRHFPHELNRMEQEAGTFVEFIVPDVHGSRQAQQHQAIWRVDSCSQNSRKSQAITQTYSNIRQSFSRGDAKSVASMSGWSAKPDLSYTEFREE